jgi:hypothetical protein
MKIAGFNGFPFHYEMFGYLINYCNNFNHELVIYCLLNEDKNNFIDLYRTIFPSVNVKYKELSSFESEKEYFDLIVLITDDDPSFDTNNIDIIYKTIRIDHNDTIRRPEIKKFIGVRPFINRPDIKWALPCYPLIKNVQNKMELIKMENEINVVILGGGINGYSISQINRLTSLNSNITLHFISRKINYNNFEYLNKNFLVYLHENINTFKMIDIVNKSDYILNDVTNNKDHYNGVSMSGSIPIAFNHLTPLIISSNNNDLYNFKSSINFDINSKYNIYIDKVNENSIKKVFEERNGLISNFQNIMTNYL